VYKGILDAPEAAKLGSVILIFGHLGRLMGRAI
jgi:hypothetical protein